ncbi:MAG: homoserine kinase [Collinsella sp.]
MIKITVPATSANLGIGYDTLGMAVSLYSHFTFERADKLTITGCPEEFQNENNLVYVSFVDALAAWGEPAFPVAIDIQTDTFPSPAAWVPAPRRRRHHGCRRADGPHRRPRRARPHCHRVRPSQRRPAIWAAPSRFTPTDSLPQCLRYEVSDRLRLYRDPPYEVHTSEARRLCRRKFRSPPPWQMGHIAGMTRGGDRRSGPDCRRQRRPHSGPYRRRLIPDYNAVRDTCLNGGAKTIWISGSGSTLMAVTDDTIVAKFLQVKLREQFPRVTHILTCDTEGAQIRHL